MATTLSVSQLREDKSQSVWVLNSSERVSRDGARDDVFVSITTSNGEQVPLVVHSTWLPTCLTDSVAKDDLLRARKFMSAVSSGLLTPIATEEAIAMMDTDEAQAELNRIDAFERSLRETTNAHTLSPVTITQKHQLEVREIKLDDPEAPADPVGTQFKAFVAKMNSLGTDKEALAALKVRGIAALNDEQVAYLLKNLKHQKLQAKLKEAFSKDE